MTGNRQMGWNAVSPHGVVAAGSAEAVAAGISSLAAGGNAADAAVATILALTVTEHGQCSIGGEVPLLIYDAKGHQVKSLSGQGRAPLSREAVDWYLKHGIPGDGDIKMAPVPSVVDLCVTTLQRYGTRTLAEVVAPTLALLDRGTEPWSAKLAVTLRRLLADEAARPGNREERLQAAADRFYGRNHARTDIADDLEAYYIEKGGFLRKADLAAHVTTVEGAGNGRVQGIHGLQVRAVDARAVPLPGSAAAGGVRPQGNGVTVGGLHPCRGRSHQTGDGRP